MSNQRENICVVVLGDLDRSPRMINHALSASPYFNSVTLVGYQGSSIPAAISKSPNIHIYYISTWLVDVLRKLPRVFYLLYAFCRILIQITQLFWILWLKRILFCCCGKDYGSFDYILIQNPPCMPLLFVVVVIRLVSMIFSSIGLHKRTKLIVDWHNYGFTIMKVNGSSSKIVKVAKWYELWFGKFADAHLCVSQAFKKDIQSQVGLPLEKSPRVVYDRATSKFQPISRDAKLDLLKNTLKLNNFTDAQTKAKVLLSSTSYTPDEDFSVLVDALKQVDQQIDFPLQVLVTGRGPLKEQYGLLFEECNNTLTNVNIHQVWVHADDYPKVVASADLGVCLHTSSSGYDLPMKVVDMFAAAVPCLAIGGYDSLPELVKNNQNGLIFNSQQELAQQIQKSITDEKLLEKWSKNLDQFRKETWDSQWQDVMTELGVIKTHAKKLD